MSQSISLYFDQEYEYPEVSIDVKYRDPAKARLALTTAYQAALQQLSYPTEGQPRTQTF